MCEIFISHVDLSKACKSHTNMIHQNAVNITLLSVERTSLQLFFIISF